VFILKILGEEYGERSNNQGRDRNFKRIEDNWKTAMKDTVPKSEAKGPCFIATAALGDYKAPEVIYLSTFPD
jgi:hypothetical protein